MRDMGSLRAKLSSPFMLISIAGVASMYRLSVLSKYTTR